MKTPQAQTESFIRDFDKETKRIQAEILTLISQRDELLEALEALYLLCGQTFSHTLATGCTMRKAWNAIHNTKKGS